MPSAQGRPAAERGGMASSTIRRALGAGLAVLALAIAVTVLLPVVAATQLVRDRIAQELGALTGQRVSFTGAPEIRVWPSFSAGLTEVRLSGWKGDEIAPTLSADRIDLELSPLSALLGRADIRSIRMDHPVLSLPDFPVEEPAEFALAGGRVLSVLRRAQEDSPQGTMPSADLEDVSIGTIEVVDGRVVEAVSGTEIASALNGRLVWPSLQEPVSVRGTGVWRGESLSLELDSAAPLDLIGGRTGDLKAALKSGPLELSFTGSAALGPSLFCDGRLVANTPSLRRALEWSGRDIQAGSSIGAVSIDGRAVCGPWRLKLEEAAISLGGNAGTGVLDASFAQTVPSIAGTLAFQTIDLGSFLSAFVPLAPDGFASGRIDTGFTDQIGLDLRISAAQALAGKVPLTELAASARVKDGLAVFDISDATAFGGSLQSSIRIDRQDGGNLVEIRGAGTEVDGAMISSALSLGAIMPRARGSFSLILRGKGDDWSSLMDRADGSFTARFGAGAITGVDLAAFAASLEAGTFFRLSALEPATVPIEGAQVKATISGGIARIDEASVRTRDGAISLAGIIPYEGRGLALSGSLSPLAPATPEKDAEDAIFFVGGSWFEPVVSPVTLWHGPDENR